MSEQRMAEMYERLVAARFEVKRPRFAYPFQLGWNACIDFAIKQLRAVCDEETKELEAAE